MAISCSGSIRLYTIYTIAPMPCKSYLVSAIKLCQPALQYQIFNLTFYNRPKELTISHVTIPIKLAHSNRYKSLIIILPYFSKDHASSA